MTALDEMPQRMPDPLVVRHPKILVITDLGELIKAVLVVTASSCGQKHE